MEPKGRSDGEALAQLARKQWIPPRLTKHEFFPPDRTPTGPRAPTLGEKAGTDIRDPSSSTYSLVDNDLMLRNTISNDVAANGYGPPARR